MVKEADIGYAVANACDALKSVADRVTVDAKDGALAAIIEELG
jgi:hydroxymethylpyrimidine pyrophosphatase-like HAD family hydrolase